MKLDCQATCAFGLEAPLARELKQLGHEQVQSENGSVGFECTEDELVRANLWLRTADRVWVVLGRFPARTFEELFEGVRKLPWGDLLPRDATFPVEGMSHGSQLSSVPAVQSVTKKAIVESLKKVHRVEQFPETGALFKVRVALARDTATIALDSSGVGLHKRGYRKLTAEAPLRETLAAGMVLLSYWAPDRTLADPFCGSGTILIEAAFIGIQRAPGLDRSFAFQQWPWIGAKRFERERRAALDRIDHSIRLEIVGSDIDPNVLQMARYHVGEAGLSGQGISMRRRSVSEWTPEREYGVMITNPPYGERQQDMDAVRRLESDLGRVTRRCDTWSIYALTTDAAFERHFGRRADRKRKLYNGSLACTYYQFLGPRPRAADK